MRNNYSNNFLNNLKNLPPHRWMMLGVILFLIFVVGASDKMIQGAFNRVEDRKNEVVVSNKTLNIAEPIFEGSEALEKKIGSLRLADHVFDSENLIVKYSLISETDNIMLIDHARVLVGDKFYELDPMNLPILTHVSGNEYEFTVKYNISGVSGNEIMYYSTVEAVSKKEYDRYMKEYYNSFLKEKILYKKEYKDKDIITNWKFEEILTNYVEGETESFDISASQIVYYHKGNQASLDVYKIVKSPLGTRFHFTNTEPEYFKDYYITITDGNYNSVIDSKKEMIGLEYFEILVEKDFDLENDTIHIEIKTDTEPVQSSQYIEKKKVYSIKVNTYDDFDLWLNPELYTVEEEFEGFKIYRPALVRASSFTSDEGYRVSTIPIPGKDGAKNIVSDYVFITELGPIDGNEYASIERLYDFKKVTYDPDITEVINSTTLNDEEIRNKMILEGIFIKNDIEYTEDEIEEMYDGVIGDLNTIDLGDKTVYYYDVSGYNYSYSKYIICFENTAYSLEVPNNVRSKMAVDEFLYCIEFITNE